MAFLAPIGAFLTTATGAALATTAATVGATLLSRPSGQPQQAALLAPNRNDALDRAAMNDNLANRTGSLANRRTPYGGAEADTGPKTSLLGRS
jgi:hypothetical protein